MAVCGVGIYYPSEHYWCTTNGVMTKEYDTWRAMLARCYSEKWLKKHPNYVGCSVSEYFKVFQNFAGWFNKQIYYPNYQLDKDLLFKNNKIYSEDTCVFLPKEVNLLLTRRTLHRGPYAIGVTYNKRDDIYIAQVNRGTGSQIYLGCFNCEEDAFKAYKIAKENYIKIVANKYAGCIDSRAYTALMGYEVTADD